MGRAEPSGVVLKPATPPPTGKVRRFPWRLWLWALLMTAAAGAAGYFTWHYRSEANDAALAQAAASKLASDAETTLGTCKRDLETASKASATCTAERGALEKASKTLTDQLKTNKDQLTELAKALELNQAQLASASQFKTQFAKMVDSGAIEVTNRHGNIVLSLPAQVLFPSGVAELSEDGKIKVHEIGFTLKDKGPKDDKGNYTARYLVVGHSDNQPLKNSVYKDNWELSTARALTVTRELVAAGMNSKNLLPAGAGEHDPLGSNSSVKEMSRNRRIEIVLLPAISELPDPKEKK